MADIEATTIPFVHMNGKKDDDHKSPDLPFPILPVPKREDYDLPRRRREQEREEPQKDE